MLRWSLALATAALLALGTSQTRASMVIDDFNMGAQSISRSTVGTTGPSVVGGLPSTSVLGGERELTLQYISATFPGIAASVVVDPVSGFLALSNGPGVSSKATLLYDGPGSSGLGGVDFASAGDRVTLDVLYVDLNVSITVKLTDTSNVSRSVTIGSSSAGMLDFLFSNPGFSGVNLASINAVELTILGPNSADILVNIVGVVGPPVPEPTTLAGALCGIALLGAGAYRSRRKAAQA